MKRHLKQERPQPAGDGDARKTAVPDTRRVLTAAMPADRSHVMLKMLPGSGASGQIALTANGLEQLIKTLGQVHAAMCEGKPIPPFDLGTLQAVFNPRWHVCPGMMGEASAFAFQHPAYGPMGFLVPIEQVETMVDVLSKHIAAAATTKKTAKN